MKKNLFATALLLVLCTLTMQAQKKYVFDKVEGTPAELKGVKELSYEADWSQVIVEGMTPKEWIVKRQDEQPEYDAQNEWDNELVPRIKYMRSTVNDKLKKTGRRVTIAADRPYTLVLTPLEISRKGDMVVKCTIKHTGGEPVAHFYVKGNGGTFGSMSNLWGDGFESAGKRLAAVLKEIL